MGHTTGNMLFVGAIVFGMGVCYFWPTMLGFVSENLPETGAVGLNLMGGAGMFAASMYIMFIGKQFTALQAKSLPPAQAGQAVLNTTLLIPVFLSVAFAGLFLYMRNKNKVAA